MRQIRQHVIDDHGVKNPSQTVLDFIASTTREA